MILVITDSEAEAVRIVNGLVAGAEHEEGCVGGDRAAARRYRQIADAIQDGLDAVRPGRRS
jgi:hypothetical protein